MPEEQDPLVIPVIREEVHADARPVHTGSVRVTKSVQTHEELLEQELRKGRADVQRVAMNRIVDGPIPPARQGNTLIISVVSEMLEGCEKHWVQTEEIRVTQIEESETVQHRVKLNEEHARVERLDAAGNVIAVDAPAREAPVPQTMAAPERRASRRSAVANSMVDRLPGAQPEPGRVLSKPNSILRKRLPQDEK